LNLLNGFSVGHPAAKLPCALFCATITGFEYFISFLLCLKPTRLLYIPAQRAVFQPATPTENSLQTGPVTLSIPI
jgi:hypothetical protein